MLVCGHENQTDQRDAGVPCAYRSEGGAGDVAKKAGAPETDCETTEKERGGECVILMRATRLLSNRRFEYRTRLSFVDGSARAR